jgi:hypothetical protein
MGGTRRILVGSQRTRSSKNPPSPRASRGVDPREGIDVAKRAAIASFALLLAFGCGDEASTPPASTSPPPSTPNPDSPPTPREPPSAGVPALPIYGGNAFADFVFGESVLYVADPERDHVARFHAESLREAGRVELPPGSTPFRVVRHGDSIFVTLRGTGSLARISLEPFTLVEVTPVCASPRGLADDGERLLVACAGGELVARHDDGREARVLLEPDLRDVVVDDRGAIFVSLFRLAEVIELNPDLSRRALYPIPDELATDAPQLQLASEDRVANTAWRMRAARGGGVDVLHQLSTRVAHAATPDPDRPSDDPSPSAGYGPIGAAPTCRRPVVSNAVTRLGAERTFEQTRFVGGGLVVDFVRRDEIHLALASTGRDRRQVVGRVQPITTDAGVRPGVSIERTAAMGGGVAVEILAGRSVVFSRDGSVRSVDDGGVSTRISNVVSTFDPGQMIFHATAGVEITCASCHAEGRDDGLVWDFGEGPRRTQALVGGVNATAPFHWKGDVVDLSTIMRRTFVGQMGGEVLAPEEVDLLGAWLDTLEAEAATVDADAAARGATIFAEVGCASCHAGDFGTRPEPAMLDGELWQVPMLRGVGLRGPFFHDGCAPVLGRVLTGCGDQLRIPRIVITRIAAS